MSDSIVQAIAERYFQALTSGDFPAALELLSPQVVWYQPGANRFSGRYQGKKEVAAMLTAMAEASEGSLRISLTGPLMVNGDHVAAPVRFSAERQGARMDMPGIDLVRVCEGLIAEVRLFSADGTAEDRFLGAR